MGYEDRLTADLVAILQGKGGIPSAMSFLDEDHQNPSSDNWVTLALGIEAVRKLLAVRVWFLAEMVVQRNQFMKKELLSRIYMVWHVIPMVVVHAMAIKAGDREVELAAKAWLRTFWTACALGAGGNGSAPVVTATGSRSWAERDFDIKDSGEPHHIHNHPIDMLFRAAIGLPFDQNYRDREFIAPIMDALAFQTGMSDAELLGLSADERMQVRTLLTGDVTFLSTVASYLVPHRCSQPYLFVRTSVGESATVLLKPAPSVSTPTLPALICRQNSKLEPVAPLVPGGPKGNHKKCRAFAWYYPGVAFFGAQGTEDDKIVTAPRLVGTELWRVEWPAAGVPPPPPLPPPDPPGEDPPPPDYLDPILVHAYATVALPEPGDSLFTAIARAKNKAGQILLVRRQQTSNPGDPILIHAEATMALPEPGDDEATTLQRAKNKAGQIILVREAEKR